MERCMVSVTKRDIKRSQTEDFDGIERIKRTVSVKQAGHTARRQYNSWSANNLQWYPKNLKRPRRRPLV